jgi:hypothetical protein
MTSIRSVKLAFYGRRALAKNAGVAPEGSGSHPATKKKQSQAFTADERAAMKERARAESAEEQGGRRGRRAREDRRDEGIGPRPRPAPSRARDGNRAGAHAEDLVRAVKKLTAAEEKKIVALVEKATS